MEEGEPKRAAAKSAPKYQPVRFDTKKRRKKFEWRQWSLLIVVLVIAAALVGFAVLRRPAKPAPRATSEESATQTSADLGKDITDEIVQGSQVAGSATVKPKSGPSPTIMAATTNEPRCERSLFEDKTIGLWFCYKTAWGKATVGSVPDSTSATGKAYHITFSDYHGLSIAAQTSDWSNTVERAARCGDPRLTQPLAISAQPTWQTFETDGVVTGAWRVEIKKDTTYIVKEQADNTTGVCWTALVAMRGSYPVIVVNYEKPFVGSSWTTPLYMQKPNEFIPSDERIELLTLLDSLRSI